MTFVKGVGQDLRRTICIDMDGVLVDFRNCSVECDGYDNYPANHKKLRRMSCPPMIGAREKLQQCRDMGLTIVIMTGRCEEERAVTEEWLKKHEIPYDDLIMDKPRAMIYVDDLAHRFDGWENTFEAIKKTHEHIKKNTEE